MNGYFDSTGFSKIVHFHSDDDLSVIDMVKQGFGVAVLSLDPPLFRTVGFAYNRHSDSIFPALAKFIRFVKENTACTLK